MNAKRWREVSKQDPCPACGKPNWCAWSPDGRTLKCERSTEPPPGMELVRACNGGALFRPAGRASTDGSARGPRRRTPPPHELDWTAEAQHCRAQLSSERLQGLAATLCVRADAIERIGTGWASAEDLRRWKAGGNAWSESYPAGAYTFPECDRAGRVIGLGLRAPDGSKGFPAGARRGIVIPDGLSAMPDPVLIVEGASDVAACLSLSLAAVGRPSNASGAELLAELLPAREVLVLGENDAKPDGSQPGFDGAIRVAQALADARNRSVARSLPPDGAKDVREWLQNRCGRGLDLADDQACKAAGRELLAALQAGARTCRPESAQHNAEAVVTALSEMEPEAVRWLWPDRIPLGKLTLLAGDPDVGKSMLTADLAARVSRGLAWPDGRPCPQGRCILLSAEDDARDTVRPRLDAAGGDPAHVFVLESVKERDGRQRAWNLGADDELVARKIEELGQVLLVVIDPISAYMPGVDSHRNTDVRSALMPLAELAQRYGVAVVAVTHLNKGLAKALYRASGSLAFIAAARAAWLVAKDQDKPDLRLMVALKSNLAARYSGLAFRIKGPPGSPQVVWEPGAVERTADEVLQAAASSEESSAIDQAVDWLRALLADGPLPTRDVKEAAEAAGLSWATVRRAQLCLRIKPTRNGFGGPWVWQLPRDSAEDAHPPEASDLSTFGGREHLRAERPENGGARDFAEAAPAEGAHAHGSGAAAGPRGFRGSAGPPWPGAVYIGNGRWTSPPAAGSASE